ncbi:hypothetical protein OG21DRAFT_1488441 [Imleria badia]|nr:hypothetical protein OG21DRAFT_1488441 [Imleria badia]
MASSLQFALTTLQQNNSWSLAVLTAIGYDYILTFSNENTSGANPGPWCQCYSFLCVSEFEVRYVGLCNLIINMLQGSSFVPGPTKMYVFTLPSLLGLPDVPDFYKTVVSTPTQVYMIYLWSFLPFFGAAEFVMILRIWAMYNRSTLILSVLLTFFSLEMISTVLATAVYSAPRNQLVATIQILNFSYCVGQPTSLIWTKVANILQMTHGAVVCTLAIFQFVRQLLRMYHATKQWQLNRYMSLLVKQGLLYFLAVFLLNLINVLAASGKLPAGGWQLLVVLTLEFVPMYTLSPRFILSTRELYARDVQGRCVGGIDSGFGLSLSGCEAVGTIVFADVEQNERSEDVEEIAMEVVTSQPE